MEFASELQNKYNLNDIVILHKQNDTMTFQAQDILNGRHNCIKRIISLDKERHANLIKRFNEIQKLEIKNLQKINNIILKDNLQKQYDSIYQLFVATKLADCSLQFKIQQKQAHSQNSMLGYLKDCLMVLQNLQAKGMHHLNINPRNILFEQHVIVLADPYLKTQYRTNQNSLNTSIYQSYYLSPEQIQEKDYYSEQKSDIFQLGLCFLQFALHLNQEEIAFCNQSQQKVDELLQRLYNLGYQYLHQVLSQMLQVIPQFRYDLTQIIQLIGQMPIDQDLLYQENIGLYQYFFQKTIDDMDNSSTMFGNQNQGEQQLSMLETKVMNTFQKGFYEQALEIIDNISPEKLNQSLRLRNYQMILVEKIAYHDRMNKIMKELKSKDDELRKKYLFSKDLQLKADYLNYQREAIWPLQFNERCKIVKENQKLSKDIFGENSCLYAQSIYQEAKIYCSHSDYKKAIEFHQKAEKVFQKAGNSFETQMHRAFNFKYWGNNHIYTKEYEKARQYYQSESNIWKSIGGEQHGEFGSTLQNLSICEYYSKNYEKGIVQLEQAIKIFTTSLGVKNQYYSSALSWMVVFCKMLKRYEEGANYSIKASLLFLDTLGDKHKHYKNNMTNLADNFKNYQKNLTGCIESQLLDKAESCIDRNQAKKYYKIANDCVESAITLNYVKRDEIQWFIDQIKYKQEQFDKNDKNVKDF
ncbi:Protein kinase-like domain [Pseudocohnilembus persalinus]|uniref:Protein kinase-like domain n=1 Tax=Pseudocohnilembus persalinus TaxID=266149 RepID=A0A0V0QSX0_PSEPJ|nr:Protein kinase-like domain [Pseudocohnilembus persalinus]|eukprot:KRX05114.1 Protein kinase-like domain [Pseudocohnilembus persalinus]